MFFVDCDVFLRVAFLPQLILLLLLKSHLIQQMLADKQWINEYTRLKQIIGSSLALPS